jgi:hypothetical protein
MRAAFYNSTQLFNSPPPQQSSVGHREVFVEQPKQFATLPHPPHEPALECCGSGCSNCVWVAYWEQLQDYQRDIELRLQQQVAQHESTAAKSSSGSETEKTEKSDSGSNDGNGGNVKEEQQKQLRQLEKKRRGEANVEEKVEDDVDSQQPPKPDDVSTG